MIEVTATIGLAITALLAVAILIGRGRLRRPLGPLAPLVEFIGLVALALTVAGAIAARARVAAPSAPTPLPLVRSRPTPMPTPTARPTLPPPPTSTPTVTPTATPTPPQMALYVVERGDTLSGIAKRFGTTVQAIREANGLGSDFLRIGQELLVPLPSPTPLPPGVAPTATPPLTPRGPLVRGPIVHVVKWRETFASIARQYGVTPAQLLAANPGVDPERLRVGQELIVPNQPVTPTPTRPPFTPTSTATLTPTPAPTLPPRGGEREYEVRPNDTLYAIAKRFGVTVEALRKRNGRKSGFLRVGQLLIIPDPLAGVPTNTPEPTRPPTATPVPTVTPSPVPPPQPVSPPDGTIVRGTEATVLLEWRWGGTLAGDEWFVVEMWQAGEPPQAQVWTKATRWQVPAELAGATWNWRVVVVRGVRGAWRTDLGPPGETWRFTWLRR